MLKTFGCSFFEKFPYIERSFQTKKFEQTIPKSGRKVIETRKLAAEKILHKTSYMLYKNFQTQNQNSYFPFKKVQKKLKLTK